MQHDLIFTEPSVVTLEVSWENSQQVATAFPQVTKKKHSLLLVTGWKYDEVGSHSGLARVRGQNGLGVGGVGGEYGGQTAHEL